MNTIIIVISIILIALIVIAITLSLMPIDDTRGYERDVYSVDSLLEELESMGFVEADFTRSSETKRQRRGTQGSYKVLRSKTLYDKCSVTISIFLKDVPPYRENYDYYSPYATIFKIRFESLDLTKYKSQTSEWMAFTLLNDNGKKINKERLDFLYGHYLAAPAIDILYGCRQVNKPCPHR